MKIKKNYARILNVLFITLSLSIAQNLFSQSCALTNYDQIIPDLFPTRTIRVAFHVIHKNTDTDHSNVNNDALGDQFWNAYIDSINHVLGNMGHPNYFFHNIHYRYDAKIRVQLHAIYHHADSELFNSIKLNGDTMDLGEHFDSLRLKLITNNNALSTWDKEKVLPIFFYDSTGFGGAAYDIRTRYGIRLQGAYGGFGWWDWKDTLEYKYVGNFIHELLHCVGIYHNHQASGRINAEFSNACDYKLPQAPATKWKFGHPSHENIIDTFLNNNFIYKYEDDDKTHIPGYNSMSYCQIQRAIWNVWNYPNYSYNSSSNINQCATYFDPCGNNHTSIIKDNQLLNYDFEAYGDIIIKKGGSLTITCKLEMPADAQIIVEPGGKLIVDEGTITSTCGDFWRGIEVKGNAVSSQYFSNGTLAYLNVGFVHIKNNSIIRNARIAILRKGKQLGNSLYKGGGIVRIENSDFVNNQYGVYMQPFEGILQGTYRKMKDASYISNTDFFTTWAYPNSTYLPEHQILLFSTVGVDVTNCNFL